MKFFEDGLNIVHYLFILDGELIMKCETCNRWYHGECDSIANEDDAEKCAEEKYDCPFCRPEDALPPHLIGNSYREIKFRKGDYKLKVTNAFTIYVTFGKLFFSTTSATTATRTQTNSSQSTTKSRFRWVCNLSQL